MPWGWGGWGRGGWRWGWYDWGWPSPWPGRGPWSFLPPWLRPGWLFGRGACWLMFGMPGWALRYYLWPYYPWYLPWLAPYAYYPYAHLLRLYAYPPW